MKFLEIRLNKEEESKQQNESFGRSSIHSIHSSIQEHKERLKKSMADELEKWKLSKEAKQIFQPKNQEKKQEEDSKSQEGCQIVEEGKKSPRVELW